MARRERVAALVLALPGVVALFLPFTVGVSPLIAVVKLDFSSPFMLLAAPAFLAVPIAAWQARRCAGGRLSVIEIGLAYSLATAAMLAVLVDTGIGLSESSLPELGLSGLALLAGCWGFAGANVLLLARNLVRRVPNEVTAEVFLLGGYLPNAVFCLIGFFPRGWFSGWDVGAYVVLIACVAYLLTIIFLLRGEAH